VLLLKAGINNRLPHTATYRIINISHDNDSLHAEGYSNEHLCVLVWHLM